MKYTRMMAIYTIVETVAVAVAYKLLNSYNESNATIGAGIMTSFTLLSVGLAGVFVILRIRKLMEQDVFLYCIAMAVVCMLMPLGTMWYLLRNLS
ncbi:hypothetical protein [Chitinophaga parva]|nr:hypothetical protein [Chitinophaga parva]